MSDATLALMGGVEKLCEPLIVACNTNGSVLADDDGIARTMTWTACLNAYTFCNIGEITPVQSTGVNPYDVRVPCGKDALCYDFSNVDAYLNQVGVTRPGRNSRKPTTALLFFFVFFVLLGVSLDYRRSGSPLLSSNTTTSYQITS